MTKGIENTLQMRSMEEALAAFKGFAEPDPDMPDAGEVVDEDYGITDAFDQSLSLTVESKRRERMAEEMLATTDSDRRLTDLYSQFVSHANSLIELGQELDPTRAPRAYEVANAFLKNAMDAVNSQKDIHFKTRKLMLDQRKLELEERKAAGQGGILAGETIEVEAVVLEKSAADLVREMHKEVLAARAAAEAAMAPEKPGEEN